MARNKDKKQEKLNSLSALNAIELKGNSFIKESPEEIAKQEMEEEKTVVLDKNELDVNHSIDIPTDVFENIINKNRKISLFANAPYNFIPLNDKIVSSDFNIDEVPFDQYHKNRFSGYISINAFTKSPIYLRDLLTLKESEEIASIDKALKELNAKSEDYKTKFERKMEIIKVFYSPGDGIFKLSGSTMRGLIRNIVEVVSFSKIGFIDKYRKFHYRAMADRSVSLKNKFTKEMLAGDGNTGFYQKVKAGYLIKVGNNYKIKPAVKPNPDCEFFRVEEDLAKSINPSNYPISVVVNGVRKINPSYKMGFKKVKFTFLQYDKQVYYSQPLRFSKVNSIFDYSNPSTPSSVHEGVLIYTGWMRNQNKGKHLHWVIGVEGNTTLDFLPGVIEDYKNDEGRVKEANLLDWFKEFDVKSIPCFYLSQETIENEKKVERVKSFGHTGIFRLAYDRSVKDLIPNNHNNSILDITEAIFGDNKKFAGRVFFEDAQLSNSISPNPLLSPTYLQTLSNPKPTTFQHYVVQKGITPKYRNINTNGNYQGLEGLRDYNSKDVTIRGNKMYWHKEEASYSVNEEDIENHLNQLTEVACIDKNTTFTGRIRFENLSDVELGALLFALDLPEGCCHKIGMGKPLGLGSIQITPTLHISDRKNRYTKIETEWNTELPESTKEEKNKNFFKNKFASYVLNGLGESGSTSDDLWKVDRLNELKTMLDFNKKPDNSKTKYMKIQPTNEFRNRPVLPKPSDVIKEVNPNE